MEDYMIETSVFRDQVLDAAKKFKANWIELAKLLFTVKRDKLFKEWGHISFDTYCAKEIGIRKQTAFKLLSSYYFLKKEEPQLIDEEKTLPGYESINILRRARANKNIKEDDYSRLKQEVLERDTEPREIGKQYRSMLSRVKAVNPEEERNNKRVTTIKRLISTLKILRKEVEFLKLLPDKYIIEVSKIISSLEGELV